MELIIALLCFFGLMSYDQAGVTKEQVEAEMRKRNINSETNLDRAIEKGYIFDRTETR